VRPSSKRDKGRSKRANDPNRQGYKEILAKSESLPDVNSPRNSYFANEEEAATVGGQKAKPKQPTTPDAHPLAQVEHAESSEGDEEEEDEEDELDTATSTLIGDDLRSPGPMMKSPHLQNLDSPELSSRDSSSDEDEDVRRVTTEVVIPTGEDLAHETKGLNIDTQQGDGTQDTHRASGPEGKNIDSMTYVENLLKQANSQMPEGQRGKDT
jgi:hypothetical protein